MNSTHEVAAEKWLPLLESATREVFGIMLKTTLESSKPEPLTGLEFTAMVGLAGCLCGVLSVRCCHESATQVVSSMLGFEPARASEHAWDALGEMANMIAGNFKNKIDGVSDKCMLSVPTVITGADYTFRSLANSAPLELWFRFQGRPVGVTLEIHS